MQTRLITTSLLLTLGLLTACGLSDFQWCFDPDDCASETGGEDGDMYCTAPLANGRWYCLRNPQHDPRVKQAIEIGLLVPWTDVGSCPHEGREWDALQQLDPIDSLAPTLRAVECSHEPIPEGDGFSICLPEQSGWAPAVGMRGAIGAGTGDVWSTSCGTLQDYALVYDYAHYVPCTYGVSCAGFADECSCKCGNDLDCGPVQNFLEDYYFGEDADGLIPYGWESTCTGLPWAWDQWAYGGVGGYTGTVCEWNGVDPGPGDMPLQLAKLIDDITCIGSTCTVPAHAIEDVLASPGLVAGSSSVALGHEAVEINACNHVCTALGLHVGDRIAQLGLVDHSPLDPSAWVKAYDELLDGRTQATIVTATHSYTLTLILEN